MRKNAFLFFLSILLLLSACVSAEYQDMKGTWIGENGTIYLLNETIQEIPANANTWIINMQKDKIISGYKTYLSPIKGSSNESFVGVFDPDGTTLNIIDQPGALIKGVLVDQNTLSMVILNPGLNSAGNRTSIAVSVTLHRKTG